MAFTVVLANGTYSRSSIEFYYTRPEIELVTEYPAFSLFSLVAEVGGFMGLFLGWSCLMLAGRAVEWVPVAFKRKPKSGQ